MRVIARKALVEFWNRPGRGASEKPLRAWFDAVVKADWSSPADVKTEYRTASFVGNDRVVFNISGNRFRLVVAVHYRAKIVFIRFIGTHEEYDRIDVKEV